MDVGKGSQRTRASVGMREASLPDVGSSTDGLAPVFSLANRPAFPAQPLDPACMKPAEMSDREREEVVQLVRLVQRDFDPETDPRGWDSVSEIVSGHHSAALLKSFSYPKLMAFFRVRHHQLKAELGGQIETSTPSVVSCPNVDSGSPEPKTLSLAKPARRGYATREYRAAFWIEQAVDLIPDDEDHRQLNAALALAEGKPRLVYRAFRDHGYEVSLSAVRNRVPECWPDDSMGNHYPVWSFEDYAIEVSEDSFVRYLREWKKIVSGAPVEFMRPKHRGESDSTQRVDSCSRPASVTAREKRRRAVIAAIAKVEEGLSSVNAALQNPSLGEPPWGRVATMLSEALRLERAAVAKLIEGMDSAAVDRIGLFLIKKRQSVGDDGDLDPKRRVSY